MLLHKMCTCLSLEALMEILVQKHIKNPFENGLYGDLIESAGCLRIKARIV